MITFIIGLLILIIGYIFYSKYVVKQVEPTDNPTPAYTKGDKIDFVPMGCLKNSLVNLLNIAGIGPIMGAIQGILFGPIAFILIPAGCVFMGGVHDYLTGMISLRNGGAQVPVLINKYLGKGMYNIFVWVVCLSLLLVSAVFIYTSGDLIAEKFFGITDFSFSNPVILAIYICIFAYFILATLFPIDKIIGRFYPFFGILLLAGTFLILAGFFTHGVTLTELDIKHLNLHPAKVTLIPIFFMTVSCGMLSGFHSTQVTIISRTLKSEYDGKKVFYGMMCLECVIAMVWAAGAMHVYSHNLVPADLIGKANVINIIANTFLPYYLTFLITVAVVILPITSGDTALRGLRLTLSEIFGFKKSTYKTSLMLMIPITMILAATLFFAKINSRAFFVLWRYFSFSNALMAAGALMVAAMFLKLKNKNFFIALIPAVFMTFVCLLFILNAKIGFNLNMFYSKILAAVLTLGITVFLLKRIKNEQADSE